MYCIVLPEVPTPSDGPALLNHSFNSTSPPLLHKNSIILSAHSQLGRSRDPYHNLPKVDFCYGKKSNLADHGTGTLINKWDYSHSSPEPCRNIDYVNMNKDSISKNLSSSKDFRELKKSNPILCKKMNSIENYHKDMKHLSSDFESHLYKSNEFRGFGKEAHNYRLPIRGVIQNKYGHEAEEIARKNEVKSHLMKKQIYDYEKSVMKNRSNHSFDLLKKYKIRAEELKIDELKPEIHHKSKLFPQPLKSSIDHNMDMGIYQRTREEKAQRASLNCFLKKGRSMSHFTSNYNDEKVKT